MNPRDELERRRVAALAELMDGRVAPDADYFSQPLAEVKDVERWRRAARAVGRRRGWRTRTGVTDRCVWMADERSLIRPQQPAVQSVFVGRLQALIDEALRSDAPRS